MPCTSNRATRRKLLAVAAGTASAVILAPHSRVAAQADATPTEGGGPPMPPLPAGATVVAEGLWNPSDLTFGPDGTLYIAESGITGSDSGTDEPAFATPNAAGTPPAAPPAVVAGQVTAVTLGGEASVIATGVTGAIGIVLVDDTLYVACGGGSVGSGFQPNAIENTVDAIDISTGDVTEVASLGDYEVENNPDGTDVNPNLYGMAADSAGQLFVADAGGNAIYAVDPTTGDFTLFTVIPTLEELTGGTPEAGAPPRQSVPTSIVIDADDNLYVLLLGIGFWPGPSVLTFAPDGTMTPGPTGLTTAVAMAMGPDGLLYATMLSDDFEGGEPAPGSVNRITADGSIEKVAEGLFFPHGLAFDDEGNLYVATNSVISSPDAPLGMVIRLDGIAAPA